MSEELVNRIEELLKSYNCDLESIWQRSDSNYEMADARKKQKEIEDVLWQMTSED